MIPDLAARRQSHQRAVHVTSNRPSVVFVAERSVEEFLRAKPTVTQRMRSVLWADHLGFGEQESVEVMWDLDWREHKVGPYATDNQSDPGQK